MVKKRCVYAFVVFIELQQKRSFSALKKEEAVEMQQVQD
jgi:hypothetical protein